MVHTLALLLAVGIVFVTLTTLWSCVLRQPFLERKRRRSILRSDPDDVLEQLFRSDRPLRGDHQTAEIVASLPLTPELEEVLCDAVFATHAKVRDSHPAGSRAVALHYEADLKWDRQGRLIVKGLARNPGVSDTTLLRVTRESSADKDYGFVLQGQSARGIGQMALSQLLEHLKAAPSPLAREALARTVLEDPRSSAVFNAGMLLDKPWLSELPESARLALCHSRPDLLNRYRLHVDTETWDSLKLNWSGSIGDLAEACKLVTRDEKTTS